MLESCAASDDKQCATDGDPCAVAARLVAGIREDKENVDALEWHLKHLTSLARTCCKEMVAAGAIQEVVYMMKCHEAYEPLMQVTLVLLVELVSCSTADEQTTLNDTGGTDVTLSLMRYYRHNAVIQDSGGCILAALVTNTSTRDAVIEHDGLDALVAAMTKLSNTNDRFQRLACNTMQYILQDEERVMTELIYRTGGIAAVVNILKHSSEASPDESVDALNAACGVIAFLSHEYEPVKVAFVDANGPLALLHAMQQAHTADAKFVLAALCAVRQLSSGPGSDATIEAFEQAGVVPTLIAIVKKHFDYESVVMGAILTLGCLAMNHYAVADTLMKARGGFSVICDAMSRHSSSADLQRTACATIGACALQKDSEYLKGAIESTPNLLQAIVTAMRQHPANEKLQFVAALTIQDLTTSIDLTRNLLDSPEVVKVLVGAMKQFPLNVGLQDAAVSVIGTLVILSDAAVMETIKASGFVTVVVGSIFRLSREEALFRKALLVLCGIMEKNGTDVRREIVSVGGATVLDYILKSIESCAMEEAALLLKSVEDSENTENGVKSTSFDKSMK